LENIEDILSKGLYKISCIDGASRRTILVDILSVEGVGNDSAIVMGEGFEALSLGANPISTENRPLNIVGVGIAIKHNDIVIVGLRKLEFAVNFIDFFGNMITATAIDISVLFGKDDFFRPDSYHIIGEVMVLTL
jgi:hypothetical protein